MLGEGFLAHYPKFGGKYYFGAKVGDGFTFTVLPLIATYVENSQKKLHTFSFLYHNLQHNLS